MRLAVLSASRTSWPLAPDSIANQNHYVSAVLHFHRPRIVGFFKTVLALKGDDIAPAIFFRAITKR
jgi:hypothetical protein